MKSRTIGTVTIACRLAGDPSREPVLVFANSLGTDARIWDDVLDLLPRGLTTLTYDKRGHGLSGAPPAPYSIDDHVGDLAGLLDSLGIGKVVICGLSVGGLIAQGFAARHPDRVAGLILCDTAPQIGTIEMWNSRIAAVHAGGLDSIADAVMERWFTPGFRADDPSFPLWRTMFAQQSIEGYTGTCTTLRDTDLTDAAHRIAVPTLCVVGENDLSTPPALVRAMADVIPGADFQTIADCGHIPPVQQPEKLAHLIIAFLDRLAPNAQTRHAAGMATRRRVLGNPHVDRAEAAKTAFDEPFQALITEAAWGHVWSRPDWSLRERSMVTIALLAALGHDEEVAMHVRATARTGATAEDLREAMLHVAIYAGVPAANHAIKIVKETLARMEGEKEA